MGNAHAERSQASQAPAPAVSPAGQPEADFDLGGFLTFDTAGAAGAPDMLGNIDIVVLGDLAGDKVVEDVGLLADDHERVMSDMDRLLGQLDSETAPEIRRTAHEAVLAAFAMVEDVCAGGGDDTGEEAEGASPKQDRVALMLEAIAEAQRQVQVAYAYTRLWDAALLSKIIPSLTAFLTAYNAAALEYTRRILEEQLTIALREAQAALKAAMSDFAEAAVQAGIGFALDAAIAGAISAVGITCPMIAIPIGIVAAYTLGNGIDNALGPEGSAITTDIVGSTAGELHSWADFTEDQLGPLLHRAGDADMFLKFEAARKQVDAYTGKLGHVFDFLEVGSAGYLLWKAYQEKHAKVEAAFKANDAQWGATLASVKRMQSHVNALSGSLALVNIAAAEAESIIADPQAAPLPGGG